MTKVSIETKPSDNYTLKDLKVGDFFLDEEKHLCMFVDREIEDFVVYYDFHSQRICRDLSVTKITYLPYVYITY